MNCKHCNKPDRDELRRLADACADMGEVVISSTCGCAVQIDTWDAEYIAAANPEAIKALLDALDAAEARVAELENTRAQRAGDGHIWTPRCASGECGVCGR